jgi:hypothetical protein
MNPIHKRKLNLVDSAREAWGRELDKRTDMFFKERKWLEDIDIKPKIEPLPEQEWRESDLREQHLRHRLVEAIEGFVNVSVDKKPKPEQQLLLEDIPPDSEL